MKEKEREIAIRAKYLSVSEVKISNPNSLIKCSEKGEGRGGEEKVGPVSRSDAFFHAVFTFYRKSFAFQPPPSTPSSILPSVSIQSEYTPRSTRH